MALLNSRGTLTRGRWDYFEQSNGWASVYGSVASGPIGAYFINNSTGAIQIDVYSLYWWASSAFAWTVALFPPPFVATAITPTEVEIHAAQPDRQTPAGACGLYYNQTSAFYTLQKVSNSVESGIVQPAPGQPFITLPPSWGIGVGGGGVAGPTELSMNVWFQEVSDNIAPAR